MLTPVIYNVIIQKRRMGLLQPGAILCILPKTAGAVRRNGDGLPRESIDGS